MRKSIAAAVIAASAATSACNYMQDESAGPTVSRTIRSATSSRSKSPVLTT